MQLSNGATCFAYHGTSLHRRGIDNEQTTIVNLDFRDRYVTRANFVLHISIV